MSDIVYAKESPQETEATNEATALLAELWPAIREVKPTDEERAAGLWSTDWIKMDLTAPPPVNVYRCAVSSDEFKLLAHWDSGDGDIGFEWWYWDLHPGSRFAVIVHEALHVLGFVHHTGSLLAYRRVVERVMRLPEVRAVQLVYARKLREPCARAGCIHPRRDHRHHLGADKVELVAGCSRCRCSGFKSKS